MDKNYTTIHLHTELSFLDSTTNYKLYVDKAVELGQKAICFTEHGNTYNWVEKKLYCEQNGIKYMHGVEIYLTRTLSENIRDNYHTILIAKNFKGFQEINKLIDLSTQDSHKYYKNRITFEEFIGISNNVVKISACLASPLSKLNRDDEWYDRLASHYDYYEIQPHINSQEQKDYNKLLHELSKEFKKPLIAGTDTHSIDKYNSECRAILQKAKKINYTDEDYYDLTYKSYDELVEMLRLQGSLPEDVWIEAIENTNVVAGMVENFELDMEFKYPVLYGTEEADKEAFKSRVISMFKDKIEGGVIKKHHIPAYKKAIREEFKVLDKIGMTGFMLFMSELLTWCLENDIPFGNCRGSIGGSRIAYITDIIDLDPEEWNTVFSRFANESRKEIGDIDVDFAPDQRQLVYNYIINRFGQDKTSYILAVTTVGDKGTIDEIGRALHYEWLKTQNKNVDEDSSPYNVGKMMSIKKEYEDNPDKTREKYPEIFYYFDGILGTTISQSMHPAGIVASPITLTDNYGTFWNEGMKILSINMEEIHEVSLVKYDILGLKNIGIIRDCRKYAGLKYPRSYEVNWNDQNVWDDMITSSVGIFQFEDDYAFSLLKKYVPIKINDMSVVNAALRPSGESYRDRLINREFNSNPSKEIDDLLADNNGFLIFQEDTIKFLTDICGFSGGEADNVRRAIGRKDEVRLAKALPKILDGYCSVSKQPREIAEQEALEFIKIIEDSSRYQFGLNHSTGYSMIGYLCAQERYYRPLEFTASYLNNAGNEDDTRDGSMLARLKNIQIRPIKFRHSTAKYSIDKSTNTIYKGISSIKFLSDKIADELYAIRGNQYNLFTDLLVDIKTNTSVDTRQLNILTILGFFSEFGKNKKLLTIIEAYDKIGNRKQLKIAEVDDLIVPSGIILRHAQTLTAKTIKDFNGIDIVREFESTVEDKSINLKERLKFEADNMGYIAFTYEKATKNIYFVLELTTYKDKAKPYITLYQVKTGETVRAKIINREVYMATPFNKGDVLVVDKMTQRPKSKLENGKWIKSKTEKESILNEYQVF